MVEPGQPALAALVERFGAGHPREPTARSTGPRSPTIAFADRRGRTATSRRSRTRRSARSSCAGSRRRPPTRSSCATCRCWSSRRPAGSRDYDVGDRRRGPLELRLDRLEARGVRRDDAERRIAAQATDEERRAIATHVIDNCGDLARARAPGRRASGPTCARHAEAAGPTEAHGIVVTPRRYHRAGAAVRARLRARARGRPARGDRRARARASSGATGSRRCSASPARGSRSRSPA